MDNLLILFEAPTLALQVLVDGLLVGAILAMPAYGMAMVWGVMNIINVAQGEFVVVGGFVALVVVQTLGINPIYAIPVSALVLYVLGWVLYKVVIFRIVDRDLFISILATFGISIMLQQILNLIFGADIQTADPHLGSWVLLDGQLVIAQIKVLSFALVLVLGAALLIFLHRSKMGRAIRATAQNARAARIMGVDTDRVYATTFALNAAICGATGALVLMTWIIHPFLGILYTVRSFLIVVVAGLGNLAGVVFAGLGLGALENYAGFIFGAEFQVAFVYLAMVVILVWRNLVLRRKRQYLA
jgi:branched-chain amino acid transport system permease protein